MLAMLASSSQTTIAFELVVAGKTTDGKAAIYRSNDGVTWNERITNVAVDFNKIFAVSDLLVATTTETPNRNIYYSRTSGELWLDAAGSYNYDLNDIVVNENADGTTKAKWIVVGGKYLDAFVVDSETGVSSWNDTNLTPGDKLNAAYYSTTRDLYLAAGDAGTMFVSSTGIPGSWTKVDMPTNVDIKDITFDSSSNTFVAACSGGGLLYARNPLSMWDLGYIPSVTNYDNTVYDIVYEANYSNDTAYVAGVPSYLGALSYAGPNISYDSYSASEYEIAETIYNIDYSTFYDGPATTYVGPGAVADLDNFGGTSYDAYVTGGYQDLVYGGTAFTGYGLAQYGQEFATSYDGTIFADINEYQSTTFDTNYDAAFDLTYLGSFNANFDGSTPFTQQYAGPTFGGITYENEYIGATFTTTYIATYSHDYGTDYTDDLYAGAYEPVYNSGIIYDSGSSISYIMTYSGTGFDFFQGVVFFNGTKDVGEFQGPANFTATYTQGAGVGYDSSTDYLGPAFITPALYATLYTNSFADPIPYETAYDLTYIGTFVSPTTSGLYETSYAGTYVNTYEGDYTSTYDTVYTTSYEVTYTGGYTGTYSTSYEGAYTGTALDSFNFNAVEYSPTASILVAVGESRGLVTSTDGGATWSNTGESSGAIQALDPSTNIVDITFSTTLNRFYIITDDILYPILASTNGTTWEAIELGDLETSELKSISSKSKVLL